MRVVLVAAVTTDGFIARHEHELANWTTKEDKQYFVRRTKELGVMVMGRTTFETIGRALPGRRMIVLTSQPDKYSVDDVEFTSESPPQLVERLKSEGVQSLAVAGGSKVYTEFLDGSLIDEMNLTVVDTEFGGGIPLFRDGQLPLLVYESGEYLSDQVSVQTFLIS